MKYHLIVRSTFTQKCSQEAKKFNDVQVHLKKFEYHVTHFRKSNPYII